MGYMDFPNHEKFGRLLRFNTSKSKDAEELFSFDQYVERMKNDQKEIYYLTGNSRESIILDPQLEIFKTKELKFCICMILWMNLLWIH